MGVTRYSKGLETRNRIIEVTRSYFFEKGLKKARITEICEIAEVKGGTFTYYFNTKRDIVNVLYGELLMQCYSFVKNNTKEPLTHLEKVVFVGFLFNCAVFRDPNTVYFHHEVNLEQSASQYINPHLRKLYYSFKSEIKLELDIESSNDVLLADSGMRRELTLDFIKQKGYDISRKDILNFAYKEHVFMGRLLDMDSDIMKKYIDNAQEFAKKFNQQELRLLI